MSNLKLLIHVGDIVAAHVISNAVSPQDMPQLIKTVHESLAQLGTATATSFANETAKPAMTLRASVKPDSVGCLECGKRFKSIKKHLATHDLTADQYRAKWSLPSSYSMVSAEYSAARSKMATAKSFGQSKAQA